MDHRLLNPVSYTHLLTFNNIELAEKIASIYRGQLFEDHYFDWNTALQSKYDLLYFELLEKIIEFYKPNNADKNAYYKKIMADACE